MNSFAVSLDIVMPKPHLANTNKTIMKTLTNGPQAVIQKSSQAVAFLSNGILATPPIGVKAMKLHSLPATQPRIGVSVDTLLTLTNWIASLTVRVPDLM